MFSQLSKFTEILKWLRRDLRVDWRKTRKVFLSLLWPPENIVNIYSSIIHSCINNGGAYTLKGRTLIIDNRGRFGDGRLYINYIIYLVSCHVIIKFFLRPQLSSAFDALKVRLLVLERL